MLLQPFSATRLMCGGAGAAIEKFLSYGFTNSSPPRDLTNSQFRTVNFHRLFQQQKKTGIVFILIC
jgi:hypothetical protein